MRVLLTTAERLVFFQQPPRYWDFTFRPVVFDDDEDRVLRFVEPLWNRECAVGHIDHVDLVKDSPKKPWRVHLFQIDDLRDRKAAMLEDGRMRLLGIGARLQGINQAYNSQENLQFMLRLATVGTDKKKLQEFLSRNRPPEGLKLGYKQIFADLQRAMELSS